MNKKTEGYNIGIDIGTGSVGYAVTDTEGNLIKINKKNMKGSGIKRNMWGSRLFEGAEVAVSTRTSRGMRRRYDRRRQRVLLLRQFFMDAEVLNFEFFERLDNSYRVGESNNFNILKEIDCEAVKKKDISKTIYHLRKYLQTCDEKADIRLIYLTLHHIVKYRGNFLYENNSNLVAANANVDDAVMTLFAEIEEILDKSYADGDISEVIDILNDKEKSKRDKSKEIAGIFAKDKIIKNIVDAFLGYKADFSLIFGFEGEAEKFMLSDETKAQEFSAKLPDEMISLFESICAVNSAVLLQDILTFENKGECTLSDAYIERFERYHDDLKNLKDLIRKYCNDEYKNMFGKKIIYEKDKKVNYTGYDKKGVSAEILYAYIKTIFKLDDENAVYATDPIFIQMKNRIENGEFLKKINTTDNGVIPYQLHLEEMRNIIHNQGKYYPFLIENEEKIESLVSFRLPYWCGPLNSKKNPEGSRQFAWSVRKDESAKVYPWNFEDVIDVDKTAEKFITTLTNYCTYLPGEKVLPKNSLLYSEYELRNEIFQITVNGEKLDAGIRKLLFERFCDCKKNSMTQKELADWLNNEVKMQVTPEMLKGFQGDGKFACSMKSYNDFARILGEINQSNYNDIEKMIYYLTVYNDKKIIRRRLSKEFTYLTEKQISAISNLKYSGWGALSHRLLDGIYVEENGHLLTVIDKMRTGRVNFMQVINEKEFRQRIEEEAAYDPDEDIEDIINGLAGSPAIKKGIRQSILVIKEIVSIMGSVPDNIFIEFAREDQESKQKKSRQKQLLKKYEELKDDPEYTETFKIIKSKKDEKAFDDRMLYLYCIQNGRSLYSGKPLGDIDSLSQNCQVDHILPRCYIKDDSIDNLALVLSSENQRKKDSLLLDDEIIRTQFGRWQRLRDADLISAKKFYNLTRTTVTSKDAKNFINRQLVETRQITKHVAELLKQKYAPQGTSIVQIKAGLTSDLRSKYSLYKNRDINDYHHAHDAFLACQLGIFIQKCFPGVYKEFDFTTAKHYFAIKNNTGAMKNKYGFVVGRFDETFTDEFGEVIWCGDETVGKIKNCLNYKDCFISKKPEMQSGKFYKETVYPAGSKDAGIRRRADMPVELYGGYSGENEAYGIIIEYTKDKKRVKELVKIPIITETLRKTNPDAINEYLTEQGYKDFRILRTNICKYQKILVDGNEFYYSSASEVHNAYQLILPPWAVELMSSGDYSDKEDEIFNLYILLSDKIAKFYPRMANVNKKLEEKKNVFMALAPSEKMDVLREILKMLHANPSNANLKAIGMRDREGRITGYSLNIDKAVFVNTSVTGIFENRIYGKNL